MALRTSVYWWRNKSISSEPFTDSVDQILSAALSRKGVERLYLWPSNGEYRRIENRLDSFVIHVYARARDTAGFQPTPKTMWGFTIEAPYGYDDQYLFEPSGDGLVIIEPDSGFAVAEVVSNNLYILFDVISPHLKEDVRTGIFRRILREALTLIGGGIPSLEQLFKGDFTAPSRKTMQEMQEGVTANQMNVSRQVAYIENLESQLQKLTADTPGAGSESVVERLLSIPEVKALSVHDSNVIIQTHTMYGVHPSSMQIHEYGEFEVTLGFGDRAHAKFKNLTRRVNYKDDSYGHPHVDRVDGFWCRGEGVGILTLLAEFEFEASLLFALHAISSVNDRDNGNYLAVLDLFPVVTAKAEYPKKALAINAETRERFAKVFNQTMDTARERLQQKINRAKGEVAPEQARILIGTFAATLQKMLVNKLEVTKHLQVEFEKIRLIPDVAGVSIVEDVLEVETHQLRAVDTATQDSYSIGSFTLDYDFRNGTVRFKGHTPRRAANGEYYQAPQLPGREGELPLGQLTSTLPQLLGELELETAVTLSINFLTSLDSRQHNVEAFRHLRRAA